MYPAKDIYRGLTPERVRELLHYDPQYGEFWWLVNRGASVKALDKAASGKHLTGNDRYVFIQLDGHAYAAHRIAWLYYYGEWPKVALDHINGNRRDNRIENLREANCVENNRNRSIARHNTSGCKGVSWDKSYGGWRADIKVNYKRIRLGCSRELSNAIAMRKEAEKMYFGSFMKAV